MVADWKWFRYDEIFEIKKGFYNKKPESNGDGTIPFIGATESNNGITSWHTLEEIEAASKTGEEPNQDISEKIFTGNCITVSNNGSVGFAFYQENDFTCSHDVNPLYLKGYSLNKYIAMFLCTLIELERYRWAYGRKWRPKRMPSSLIKLPVCRNGKPDWMWIEKYMRQNIIPALPSKSKAVWNGAYNNKPISSIPTTLDSVKWDWFNVRDIFPRIEKCKCSNATELLEDGDDIAYIGAKKSDNGVMRYVKYDETLVTKGNCIVFIGDGQGSVGYCIYQPKDFIGSTTLVAGYNPHLNQYIAQFLIAILDKERYRYSFGRKYNKAAITSTKIKLPSKSKGTPDWEFMENYIKSLPYSANI